MRAPHFQFEAKSEFAPIYKFFKLLITNNLVISYEKGILLACVNFKRII